MREHPLFVFIDLLGTFAFGVSGALAAEQKRLDLFGLFAVSYMTACGGGIVRDLCLGALPPIGISDWRYLVTALAASVFAICARPIVENLKRPVAIFDSLGLGFFAAVGAHKALLLAHSIETAIILGTVAAVGGGALRDMALNRVPIIMQKEIYALAAAVGAAIQVLGQSLEWRITATPWFAVSICLTIRLLALRYSWSLPVIRR